MILGVREKRELKYNVYDTLYIMKKRGRYPFLESATHDIDMSPICHFLTTLITRYLYN